LFYNDAGFLLAMTIADGALVGYDTLDDVRQQVIPTGKDEVILRFKGSALDRPIVRKCTKAGGVTDDPMPKSAFLAILRALSSVLITCGTCPFTPFDGALGREPTVSILLTQRCASRSLVAVSQNLLRNQSQYSC
jgi:hypothetical protein